MNYAPIISDLPALPTHRWPVSPTPVDLARVDQYWADFLGCTVWQFRGARQTQVIAAPAQEGLWAIARQGSWLVTLPAPWLQERDLTTIAPALERCFRPGMLPTTADLAGLFAHFPGQQWYGPALIFVHDAAMGAVRADVSIRPVTVQDARAVAAFAAVAEIPWTLAEPQIWRKVFGLFVGRRLVSSCAVRVWGELLAEIYIDTDPAFRAHGYGKAVTNAALQWIRQSTPYYAESVVELANRPSIKLLRHLGGRPYGYTVMSFPKAP